MRTIKAKTTVVLNLNQKDQGEQVLGRRCSWGFRVRGFGFRAYRA